MKPRDEIKDEKSKPGSIGEVKEADDESQQALNRVLISLYDKFPHLQNLVGAVVQHKTQVVAGKNYFLKAKFSSVSKNKTPDRYLHLRVFRNLKGEYQLIAALDGKLFGDPIEYF